MSPNQLRKIVAQSSLYRGLSEPSVERILGLSRIVRFHEGQEIFGNHVSCPGVYVVGTGMVRLMRSGPSGKVHVLRFVQEGGSFGEAAVIGGFPAPVAAVAHTELECALFPAAAFRALIEDDHALCLEIMRSMAGRVHKLVDLLEDLILRDAMGRVASYISEHAPGANEWLTLPVLKQDLARHLNLTSETLSRTLRRLARAGAIEVETGRLHLTDRALLTDIAGGRAPKLA